MALDPTTILMGGLGLAFLLLIVGLVITLMGGGKSSALEERLEEFITPEYEAELKEVRKAGEDWWKQLNKRAERTSWWERLRREMIRAGLRITPTEYIAFRILALIGGVAVVGYVFGHGNWLFVLGGAVAGWFAPHFFIRWRQRRRLNLFESQMVDTLNLLTNGLRAGFSVLQAIESVATEMPPPTSEEFRRVVQEVQIGLSLEEALQHLLERVPSEDMEFVVTAMKIQREVGGSLAEILDTISFTIRERIRIKGEIRTLTAQARISGAVLALAPIFLFLVINAIAPEYTAEFFQNGLCGYGMLGCGLTLIGVGYMVMMKIADIEV